MIPGLDNSLCLIYDSESGALAAVDFMKQDLRIHLEPNKIGGDTNPAIVIKGKELQIVTITYEQAR